MSAALHRWSTIADVLAKYPARFEGQTALITGPALNGLGGATALTLAKHGLSKLVLVGRTLTTLDETATHVHAIRPDLNITKVTADFTSPAAVRHAAEVIMQDGSIPTLDIVVNIAGASSKTYQRTEEGFELVFASNYLGHFLLTNLIINKVLAAAKKNGTAKIVNLTSGAYQFYKQLDFDDWNTNEIPQLTYPRAKMANVAFTKALVKKYESQGIVSFSANPGYTTTGFGRNMTEEDHAKLCAQIEAMKDVPGIRLPNLDPKTLEQGASGIIACLAQPDHPNGAYISDTVVEPLTDVAENPVLWEALWKVSNDAVGSDFAY